MRNVKDMSFEELVAVWETALRAPVDEPVSQFVADVVAELEEREKLENE